MIRLAIRFAIFLAAAAIGLAAAVLLLEDMTIDPASFLLDIVIFAVLRAVLSPFILKTTVRNASAIAGATGLIATYLALLITAWLSDGMRIDGVATWALATLIIWIGSMLASLLIPLAIAKGLLGAWLRRRCEPDGRGAGSVPIF